MKAPPERGKLFALAVPIFLPVWRRDLAVALPNLWAMVEFSTGQVFWGLIFVGLGGRVDVHFNVHRRRQRF